MQSQDNLNTLLKPDFAELAMKTIDLAGTTERVQTAIKKLQDYLNDEEISSCVGEVKQGIFNFPRYHELLSALAQFDSMCRLDQMKVGMDNFKQKLIERCRTKLPIENTTNPVKQWCEIIENSFLHTWILQIEDAEPHVKDVSTEIYEKNLSRYCELIKQKRDFVPKYIDIRQTCMYFR